MLVVNLFGVPGAGKSTGAAYIFSMLKMAGVNAEIITEFAKDKVWENNDEVFKPDNQVYLFAKQFYKMSRCRDKVDVLVTDSPLPLCILYNHSEVLGEDLNRTVMNCFKSFDNMCYLLTRAKPYNPKGRFQTEEESNALAAPLKNLLDERNIEYSVLLGDIENYDKIVQNTLDKLNKNNMTKEEFIEKYCRMCGTQRCDGTDEWLEGCPHYRREILHKPEKVGGGIIIEFDPHRFVVRLEDGTEKVVTCEAPDEFDYDIIKKIWEG